MEPTIPTDQPSALDLIKSLTTLEQQAIVRPNNPPPGIAGFLFDIPKSDAIELTSDITDHYVEDNTAINDQIALRPEHITVVGLVAELVSVSPKRDNQVPTPAALPLNSQFVPELSPQAQAAQDTTTATVTSTSAAVGSQQTLWGYFDAQTAQQPNQTKQTRAFLYFYALWRARMLFTVETAMGTMTNMAIETIRQEQGEESKYESEVRLVLKKVRTAAQLVIVTGQLAGRSALQAADTTKNGNAGQTPQTPAQKQSWLYQMLHPTP